MSQIVFVCVCVDCRSVRAKPASKKQTTLPTENPAKKAKTKTVPSKAKEKPEQPQTSPQTHPFEKSPVFAEWKRCKNNVDAPVEVGDQVAFFFHASDGDEGFIDARWYIGEILQLKKPHFADVLFTDGKLWMKLKGEDRGGIWFNVQKKK